MNNQNDPLIQGRHREIDANRSNASMWAAGAVAVALVLGLVMFATTRNTNTAKNERPAPTAAPPATTASARLRRALVHRRCRTIQMRPQRVSIPIRGANASR